MKPRRIIIDGRLKICALSISVPAFELGKYSSKARARALPLSHTYTHTHVQSINFRSLFFIGSLSYLFSSLSTHSCVFLLNRLHNTYLLYVSLQYYIHLLYNYINTVDG